MSNAVPGLWICTEGATGHVAGPGWRVPALVVRIAPTSMAVRFTPPEDAERTEWFNTEGGKRHFCRIGDTAEWGWRFEP